MTSVAVPAAIAAAAADALAGAGLRRPEIVGNPGSDRTLVWTPDLSAPELATATDIVAAQRQGIDLTAADWAAIAPRRDALKAFRQQSAAEFMAKTANQRDRELFDAMNDLIVVVLRLLRE